MQLNGTGDCDRILRKLLRGCAVGTGHLRVCMWTNLSFDFENSYCSSDRIKIRIELKSHTYIRTLTKMCACNWNYAAHLFNFVPTIIHRIRTMATIYLDIQSMIAMQSNAIESSRDEKRSFESNRIENFALSASSSSVVCPSLFRFGFILQARDDA